MRLAGFKPPKAGRKPPAYPPIDVWLAPVEGGKMYVPVRLHVDSDFGGVVARATHLTVGGAGNPG